MKNLKYRYNPSSASYEEIEEKWITRLRLPFFIVLSVISIAGFIWMSLSAVEAKRLASGKSTRLSKELAEMKTQYAELTHKMEDATAVLQDLEQRDERLYRAYFELESISDDVREAGFGGTDRYKSLRNMKYGDFVATASEQLDILNNQLLVQSRSLDEINATAKTKSKALEYIPAIQPLANKDLQRLASGYGMRRHPILGIGKMHWGMDFKADPGKPIYATANGVVERSDRMGGYGNVVMLNHTNGYKTLYAHMQRQNVTAGQTVMRGDVIGYVGNSGLSSGPHLHYEVIKGEEKVNPISYFYEDLSPDEFKRLYDMSKEMSISLD